MILGFIGIAFLIDPHWLLLLALPLMFTLQNALSSPKDAILNRSLKKILLYKSTHSSLDLKSESTVIAARSQMATSQRGTQIA